MTGEAFNAGCGGRVTVNELVEMLNDLLGSELDPKYDPPRLGDVRHSHADISKAEELLGYEPEVDFDEVLKQAHEYYS